MQPYATLGAVDHAASVEFFDAVLAAIGWRSHMSFPGWRAYSRGGSGEGFVLWIVTPFDGAQASAGNGTMVGLPAVSHDEVDAFHASALRHGGSSEGAPGTRPQYGPNWYSAYVRDPTGNKIAVVCNP